MASSSKSEKVTVVNAVGSTDDKVGSKYPLRCHARCCNVTCYNKGIYANVQGHVMMVKEMVKDLRRIYLAPLCYTCNNENAANRRSFDIYKRSAILKPIKVPARETRMLSDTKKAHRVTNAKPKKSTARKLKKAP